MMDSGLTLWQAMESHSRGRGGNHLLISTDMAYDMARIAHILAHHVVEITDIGALPSPPMP
jgi:hypothetical protein